MDVSHLRQTGRVGGMPVKVDIGRSSIFAIVLGILVFGLLSAGGVYAALDTTETAVTVIGLFFAVFFGLFVVICLLALPKAIQPRGFVFDGDGIQFWHGQTWTRMPWSDVASAGIGYDQPREAPSLPLSIEDAVKDFVVDKAKEALHMDGKRRFGLEIVPVDAEAVRRYPALAQYHKEQRWRFPIPPVLGTVAAVERGVKAHREQVWLGWYRR
jgi:hypothetical protein